MVGVELGWHEVCLIREKHTCQSVETIRAFVLGLAEDHSTVLNQLICFVTDEHIGLIFTVKHLCPSYVYAIRTVIDYVGLKLFLYCSVKYHYAYLLLLCSMPFCQQKSNPSFALAHAKRKRNSTVLWRGNTGSHIAEILAVAVAQILSFKPQRYRFNFFVSCFTVLFYEGLNFLPFFVHI